MTLTIPHNYSPLEAFVYDRLIAGYTTHLRGFILEQGDLAKVLALPKAQGLLDVSAMLDAIVKYLTKVILPVLE